LTADERELLAPVQPTNVEPWILPLSRYDRREIQAHCVFRCGQTKGRKPHAAFSKGHGSAETGETLRA
jgi:hypothetical protein